MLSKRFHHTVGESVPWTGHIRDDVVQLDDDGYFAMLEVDGVPWQTDDDDILVERKNRLNHTWIQLSHDSITLTVWQHRGPAPQDIYPISQHRPGFATDLDLAYRAHLLDGRLYQNRIFIGIQIQTDSAVQTINRFLSFGKDSSEPDQNKLDKLEQTVAQLMTELASYRPRRLGVRFHNRITFSEIAEAVHLSLTGVWRPIGLTTGKLGDALFDSHIHIGWDTLQFLMPGDERFALMLGMQRFPAETTPLMFRHMLSCSYQCTIVHSYRYISTTKSLSILEGKKFLRARSNDQAKGQAADLSVLAGEISGGEAVMGDYCCGVLVFERSAEALRRVSFDAWSDLANTGAKITRESWLGLKPAYLSMIPGNARMQIRPGYVTSQNMACFAPMHGFPTGQVRGHWGAPICLFRSQAGTAIYFHWQSYGDDVGNTLLTGETGSGKSTLAAFLLVMTSGRAKIIALDHKRGWNFLIRAMNGQYTLLGAGRPSFAPLKALEPTDQNLAFLFDLIRGCIMSDGGRELTPDEDQRLVRAISTIMTELPPEDRSLWEIRPHLGVDPEGAGARLEKWCRGRELGWVLDAETDSISLDESLCGLDTTALLDNDRAKGPALTYLFHRINLALDGKPTLIAVDEGWKALGDEIFGAMIEAQLRTIRSKNGVFAFITQGAEDITKSGLAGVLVQQCTTQIHLPSPRATESDYVDGLKRTRGEFAALKELDKGSGLFLLCQGRESTIAQLPLHGLDDIINVLSARASAIKAFDHALTENGGDTADALRAARRARQVESAI